MDFRCETKLILCVVLMQYLASVESRCLSSPTITEDLQTTITLESDTYTLECSAEGKPSISYSWKKNTLPLITNSRYLTIDSSGRYTCYASNDCGTAVQEFRVAKPWLTSFSRRDVKQIHGDEGSQAILECDRPRGWPTPSTYWTVGPYMVALNERVNVDNKTGDLIFTNLLRKDRNYYRCNAENTQRVTKYSERTELRVAHRNVSSIQNHGPRIVTAADARGLRGHELRLECIATGRPTPTITWTRVGEPIRGQVRQESYGMALVFDELELSDAGTYTCQAESDGKLAFKNVTLTVKSALFWITKPFGHITIGPGRSITLNCSAEGVPNATVRWLLNGEEVEGNEITPGVRIEENRLVVSNATANDTGILQCIAENTHGHIFTNVFLNVKAPYPHWATWSRWTECTVSCGNGVQHRTRYCTGFDPYDGTGCVGKSAVKRSCNNFPCPDCSRICAYGILNQDCDACICDTSVLNGRVADRFNRPLSGATIVYTERPYVIMATTNSTGMFSISGICSEPQNMTVRKDLFTTVDQKTAFVDPVTSTLYATLSKMELPLITENPRDKVRTIGQSVVFCCRAESDPPPNEYEWFKNGDIIETAAAEKPTLILYNLSEADSGSYKCRVHNEFGRVYSDAANLTVAASSVACNATPISMLMKLPSDCVQPDSNKAEYDVGTCDKNACSGPLSSETSCSDPELESYCCQPIDKILVNLQCEDYTMPVQKVVSCGCSECAQLPTRVFGTIKSSDTNDVLEYVSVYYKNEQVAISNEKGTFNLELPSHLHKASLTFKDAILHRVVDTVKIIQLRSGFTSYRVIKMKPRPVPITVDSSTGISLPVASDSEETAFAEIIIEPDSMYDAHGDLVTGEVEIEVNNIDMRNESNAEISPGEFSFVDENGDVQALQTFNLWSIDVKDKSGRPVSIGGTTSIVIDQETLPPCNFDENRFCDTKIWILNPSTGLWEVASELRMMTDEEESKSRRKKRQGGRSLIGNIDVVNGKISYYNIDLQEPNVCYVKVLAYDSEELDTPIGGGYEIQGIVTQRRNPWFRCDTKSANGADGACIRIPCYDPQDKDSITATMTATFDDRYLVPVDSSSSDKLGLTRQDVTNLGYALEEGPSHTAMRINPQRMLKNVRNGPILSSPCSAYKNPKHFKFYLPRSRSSKEVSCETFESAPETVSARTYITFYKYLPQLKSQQKYCFIGIRVKTSYKAVHIKVTSKVNNPSSLSDFPGSSSNAYKGETFGSREIVANPDGNGHIDACMEFKCGEILSTGMTEHHGQDKTRVEVEVKRVQRRCTVRPSSTFEGYLKGNPTCRGISRGTYTTPFCFIDPLTYGDNIGIFKRNDADVQTGRNSNDPNSPQSTNIEYCRSSSGSFTPGLFIDC